MQVPSIFEFDGNDSGSSGEEYNTSYDIVSPYSATRTEGFGFAAAKSEYWV